MIEISRFAQEQLKRTDLSEAERVVIGEVVALSNPWQRKDSRFVLSEELLNLLLEDKVGRETLSIGGKDGGQLEKEILKNKIQMGTNGLYMLKSKEFTTLKYPEEINLFFLTSKDMSLSDYSTTKQINERKDELGLDFCPAEVGPHYRLKYTNQPLNEYCVVWHKPISDSYGGPSVFTLERLGGGLWLRDVWASAGLRWLPEGRFVFGLRKLET